MPGDTFLKIDGIPGTSRNPRHTDEMEVEGWSRDAAANSSLKPWSWGIIGLGFSAANPWFQTSLPAPLVIIKPVDLASPSLVLAAKAGKVFPRAVLTEIENRGGNEVPRTVKVLTDVRIRGAGTKHSSGKLVQELVLEYKSIADQSPGSVKPYPGPLWLFQTPQFPRLQPPTTGRANDG
jgi:type VI secretion system secreted protein Hcp